MRDWGQGHIFYGEYDGMFQMDDVLGLSNLQRALDGTSSIVDRVTGLSGASEAEPHRCHFHCKLHVAMCCQDFLLSRDALQETSFRFVAASLLRRFFHNQCERRLLRLPVSMSKVLLDVLFGLIFRHSWFSGSHSPEDPRRLEQKQQQ